MNISNTEVINYINTYFHPYIDFELSLSSTTEESINLVISLDDLYLKSNQNILPYFTHDIPLSRYQNLNASNIKNYLSKYPNTNIKPDYKIKLQETTDGDTIKVYIQQKFKNTDDSDETQIITYNSESYPETRVRLVGINTPESNYSGYETSKEFLNKICSLNPLYLAVDKENPIDKYGRTLGVVIYNNKNINQVLLEEGLAEIMFVPPSQFNPYEWSENAHVYQRVTNSEFSKVAPFLNEELSNIAFTNQGENITTIYRFEPYKGNLYIKLSPYNQNIRMHILPTSYDFSSNLLIFKDEDIITEELDIGEQTLAPETIIDRKDANQNIKELGFNNECQSGSLNRLPAINMLSSDESCIYQMIYDISDNTRDFKNLQINAEYRYTNQNDNVNFKLLHLCGVLNESPIANANEKNVLTDANLNNIPNPQSNTFVNHVLQVLYDENEDDYTFPEIDTIIVPGYSNNSYRKFNNESGTKKSYATKILIRDTIKYLNNDMFSSRTVEKPSGMESIQRDWRERI